MTQIKFEVENLIFVVRLKILSVTDKNELLAAKTFLEQASAGNWPEFLKALSDVLVTTTYSPVARTAAGLQLKNQLTSKDTDVAQEYQNRWLSIPEMMRDYIKKNVSSCNGTSKWKFPKIRKKNTFFLSIFSKINFCYR